MKTPEHIVQARIQDILQRPGMWVSTFGELEIVLYTLVVVLQEIQGIDISDRPDDPCLRKLSVQYFGGGSLSLAGKIHKAYGLHAWDDRHPEYEKCFGLYRAWVSQFLPAESK